MKDILINFFRTRLAIFILIVSLVFQPSFTVFITSIVIAFSIYAVSMYIDHRAQKNIFEALPATHYTLPRLNSLFNTIKGLNNPYIQRVVLRLFTAENKKIDEVVTTIDSLEILSTGEIRCTKIIDVPQKKYKWFGSQLIVEIEQPHYKLKWEDKKLEIVILRNK